MEKVLLFVRISAASVEGSCIPLFRSKPNDSPFINPLPPFSEDVVEMRDLLKNGPFSSTSFTLRRVRKALRLVRPDFEVGMGADSDSEFDGPAPCDVPAEETNARSSKSKDIILGDIDFSVGLRKDRYEKRQVKTREPDRSHLSVSPMGEDEHHQGHLAHGRGRPAPWSSCPWARTTSTVIISPTCDDDLCQVHLALGRGKFYPSNSDSFRLSCPLYSCDI